MNHSFESFKIILNSSISYYTTHVTRDFNTRFHIYWYELFLVSFYAGVFFSVRKIENGPITRTFVSHCLIKRWQMCKISCQKISRWNCRRIRDCLYGWIISCSRILPLQLGISLQHDARIGYRRPCHVCIVRPISIVSTTRDRTEIDFFSWVFSNFVHLRTSDWGSVSSNSYCIWPRITICEIREKARENFQGENNKRFDLTLFRKETIRIVFDALHGIINQKARDENFVMKQLGN